MQLASQCISIFDQVVADYHLTDQVDAPCPNPYQGLDGLLYKKCWVDAVQWHLEDLIRDPAIDPVEALKLKRRIDQSNQLRTDLVEQLDTFFMGLFSGVATQPDVPMNTETPAWALDRLSILALKYYHMDIEAHRPGAAPGALEKWQTLMTQRTDLMMAIDGLLSDLESGRKRMRLYKQMKMYNDPLLNPVLYGKK